MTRQVAQIIKKNSENTIPSAPFIACYIKDLQFDRQRLQDPTFVSKINIRERDFDAESNSYLNTQGGNYTIERIMPTPYTLKLAADIWTSNTDQKLQIWEQLVIFFTPSFEIQTTDNYIDWTSLSVIELDTQQWSSRNIPQGTSEDIDILNMTFNCPIWITPPAKVKKLGIVTKIISNIFTTEKGEISGVYNKDGIAEGFDQISPDTTITVTPGNYDLLVLNGSARLIKSNGQGEDIDLLNDQNTASWYKLLDLYPGKFQAGLTQLRFSQPDGNEVIAYVSLNPSDDRSMMLNIDSDTVPNNTVIDGRGTIDAVVNPETYKPDSPAIGTRYLILEDININDSFNSPGYDGPDAWKNSDNSDFQAHANDIIEWDGSSWSIVFNSQIVTDIVYITNTYTGTQYKWDQGAWTKTYEGIYQAKLWRLIL